MWRVFHQTCCQILRFCYLLWVACVMEVLATPCKCLRDDPHKRLMWRVFLSMCLSLCAINIDVTNKNNNNIIILMCECVGLYLFHCGKVHVGCVDLYYLQGLGF